MLPKFSISSFKSPKIANDSRFRCLWTRIPVSSNSYTGVCELVYRCRELVYRCLRTRIPVSMNSYTGVCEIVYCQYILWGNSSRGVYKLVFRCLRTRIPVSWTRIPVSVNSYTGVIELVYRCSEMVYSRPCIRFHNTGIRVRPHRYTSSQTPVYEFTDTGSASFLQYWTT